MGVGLHDDRLNTAVRQGMKSRVEVIRHTDLRRIQFDPETPIRKFQFFPVNNHRSRDVHQEPNPAGTGDQLEGKLQLLADQTLGAEQDPGHVASRMRHAGDQSEVNGVCKKWTHDGNSFRQGRQRDDGRSGRGEDHIRSQISHLLRERWQSIQAAVSGTKRKLEIPTLDEIELFQSLHKGVHHAEIALPSDKAHDSDHGPFDGALRPGNKRPRGRRTSNYFDELAPPHYLPRG
jgi:hypothetical protein